MSGLYQNALGLVGGASYQHLQQALPPNYLQVSPYYYERDSNIPIKERLSKRKAQLEEQISGLRQQLQKVEDGLTVVEESPALVKMLDVLGKVGMGI